MFVRVSIIVPGLRNSLGGVVAAPHRHHRPGYRCLVRGLRGVLVLQLHGAPEERGGRNPSTPLGTFMKRLLF